MTNRENITMAKLSDIVYRKFESSSEEYTKMKSEIRELGFQLVGEPISISSTHTQCVVVKNQTEVVVAFRGTELDGQDILTDARANIDVGTGQHEGFQSSFISVQMEIVDRLKMVVGLPVTVTGHSLGGAIAMITASMMDYNIKKCVTFGAPPPASDSAYFNNQVEFVRYVNDADVVPKCMVVGGATGVAVTAVTSLVKSLFNSNSIPDRWEDKARDLFTDLHKYTHKGEVLLMTKAGECFTGLSDHEVMSRFFTETFEEKARMFADHKMIEYLSRMQNEAGKI